MLILDQILGHNIWYNVTIWKCHIILSILLGIPWHYSFYLEGNLVVGYSWQSFLQFKSAKCVVVLITAYNHHYYYYHHSLLARWLTSARAYRIGGRKLCPSVCLYVKRYLLLQFCTDYNQTWINMIWAVAAKTWLCQIFHKWRKIEVNCVYISRCAQLVSYFWNAGMHTK